MQVDGEGGEGILKSGSHSMSLRSREKVSLEMMKGIP